MKGKIILNVFRGNVFKIYFHIRIKHLINQLNSVYFCGTQNGCLTILKHILRLMLFMMTNKLNRIKTKSEAVTVYVQCLKLTKNRF